MMLNYTCSESRARRSRNSLMAHDTKSPASSGPQRNLPAPPPYLAGGPWHSAPVSHGAGGARTGTGAGAEGVSKSNPVSWAIEELQGDQNVPEPSQHNVATPEPGKNPFAA